MLESPHPHSCIKSLMQEWVCLLRHSTHRETRRSTLVTQITMPILRHHFVSRIFALRPRVLLPTTRLSFSSARRKDTPRPRVHRVHNIPRKHGPSQTSTTPRRVHLNNACASRIPEPQTRHAGERLAPQQVRTRASRHDGRREALRIRQSACVRFKASG